MTTKRPSQTCKWPSGTVWTGPRSCGKPAKATAKTWYTDLGNGGVLPVCGIHANSATRQGWPVERGPKTDA